MASVLRVRKMMVDREDKLSHAAYLHLKSEFAWLATCALGSTLTTRVLTELRWSDDDAARCVAKTLAIPSCPSPSPLVTANRPNMT